MIYALSILMMLYLNHTNQPTTHVATKTLDHPLANYDRLAYTDFTEQDIELLAKIIMHECGAEWCGDEMKYNTGYVVLNRVASDDFPDTIYDVIYQPGQYSGVSCIETLEYSDHVYEIAEDIILNGVQIPENVVYQANFVQGSGIYVQVQNMYFCYK